MKIKVSVLSVAILLFISVFLIDVNVHADESYSFEGMKYGELVWEHEGKIFRHWKGDAFFCVANSTVVAVSDKDFTLSEEVEYKGEYPYKPTQKRGVYVLNLGMLYNGDDVNPKFNGTVDELIDKIVNGSLSSDDFTNPATPPLTYVYDSDIPVAPLKDKQLGFTWSNISGPDALGECQVTAQWDDTEALDKYSSFERRIQINYDLCDLKYQLILNATKPEYEFVVNGFHPYTYDPYDGVPFSDLKFSRATPQFMEDFQNAGHAIENRNTSRGSALAFRFRDTYYDPSSHTVYYGPWYVIQSNEIESGPFFKRFKFNYGIPLINTYQSEVNFTNAGKIADTTAIGVGTGSYGDENVVVEPGSVDNGIISTGSGLTPADAENNAAYNAGVDAESDNQAVDNGAGSLKETLQSLIEMIGSFPQMIAAIYSFLPNWALLFATIMFCSLPTIAFIKFIKS